jgi:flagellar hook-basal body complex protein FliE
MKIIPAAFPVAPLDNAFQPGPTLGSAGDENPFRKMLAQVSGSQSQADSRIQQTLTGSADLHDAMLALENANLGLKFLVQVRNKLLQAYEELSRMPM